jgi:hypothetical protein
MRVICRSEPHIYLSQWTPHYLSQWTPHLFVAVNPTFIYRSEPHIYLSQWTSHLFVAVNPTFICRSEPRIYLSQWTPIYVSQWTQHLFVAVNPTFMCRSEPSIYLSLWTPNSFVAVNPTFICRSETHIYMSQWTPHLFVAPNWYRSLLECRWKKTWSIDWYLMGWIVSTGNKTKISRGLRVSQRRQSVCPSVCPPPAETDDQIWLSMFVCYVQPNKQPT